MSDYSDALADLHKRYKEEAAKQQSCPNCGYCPHCGQSTKPWGLAPVYPSPWWYQPPTYPTITWTSTHTDVPGNYRTTY